VNSIAVEATRELLLSAGPARLDGVRVIGVDEHKWSHVLGADADGFVTVITDLTSVVAGHGPARLLDMVPGRSAAAMAGWLAERSPEFRAAVEIVAINGFGGYKNAATEALPDAVTVMDPFQRPCSGAAMLATAPRKRCSLTARLGAARTQRRSMKRGSSVSAPLS
jgi:transposase